jgi:hypothetical protein
VSDITNIVNNNNIRSHIKNTKKIFSVHHVARQQNKLQMQKKTENCFVHDQMFSGELFMAAAL